MKNGHGKLFIITGPSGVGKGTILNEFFIAAPNARYSTSSTTRKPREGELHGKHYYFISEKEFLNSAERGEFLEYAQYGGNYYGTSEEFVSKTLSQGYDVILEIEVQGAKEVMKKRPDAISIFISPPSLEELERRLRGRKTEDEASILKRLEIARAEIAETDLYKYNFKNITVEDSLSQLQEIYDKENSGVA